jgi:hypothetical protein
MSPWCFPFQVSVPFTYGSGVMPIPVAVLEREPCAFGVVSGLSGSSTIPSVLQAIGITIISRSARNMPYAPSVEITERPLSVSLGVSEVEASWNVMAHAQKPHFVFRPNRGVHLNQRGRQFSLLPAAEVCASAVVMLDTPCSEVVWRVLATHSIRQFSLHFASRASPCAITFQLESTHVCRGKLTQECVYKYDE